MREAISSALNQTYKNLEVIVINDGSTDNGETDSIARSYGNQIRYFSKPNGGVATALNLGIEMMTGEYFSWLSHDDVYKPDKIANQMETITQLGENTILYSGYEIIDEKSNVIQRLNHRDIYSIEKLNTALFPVFRGLANGCTMLIHKKHFARVGTFDVFFPTTQDYRLWFKMFKNANVHYCEAIDVQMRTHPMQGSKIDMGHIEECNELWIYMLDNISIIEMCEMEGTPSLFFTETYQYLSKGPYKKAIEYCKQKCAFKEIKYDSKIDTEKLNRVLIKKIEALYQENVALKKYIRSKRTFINTLKEINFIEIKWRVRESIRVNGYWNTILKSKKIFAIVKKFYG